MAEQKIVCGDCHNEQSVVLRPDTKFVICEQCLAVINITSFSKNGPTSSQSRPPPSPHPPLSRPPPSPATSLASSMSLPYPYYQQPHPNHHDIIPKVHPLAQHRSASMSRTQVHERPILQHQSTFKGAANDLSMLNLPEILPFVPMSDKDPEQDHSPPISPLKNSTNPFLPLSSPQSPLSPSKKHPPTIPNSTKPVSPLSTHGVQLYRHISTPNPLQYQPKPMNAQGSKRAVICGISYHDTILELRGCLNDAKCMRHLLMSKFHFPDSAILVLTEDQLDPRRQPTKYNIMQALEWLVQGCQSGDSLVFHFSGHGSQQRNYKGEELDGFDETLVPVDFMTAGQIIDDDINSTIVRPLPTGVDLHAIVDACHSGTVLDLPFLYRNNGFEQFKWEDHRPATGTWKGTAGGNVYCFSGCDDNQTVFDTVEDLGRVTSTGEMTYCFIQAIERGYGTTYGSLLNAMRSAIHKAEDQPVTSLIDMLLKGGSYDGGDTHEPQLTSSNCFNVSTPFRL